MRPMESAWHAKSHSKVRQAGVETGTGAGTGAETGDCMFSIDLSAFNCRQAANESRATCRSA